MQPHPIHIQIEQTAIQSAYVPLEKTEEAWVYLLERILDNWRARVQIDLHEAVRIMQQSVKGEGYEFWYNRHYPTSRWRALLFPSYRAFMMYKKTIAVFETINCLFYYHAPIPITFDKESLVCVLEKGYIGIVWNEYNIPQELAKWETRSTR